MKYTLATKQQSRAPSVKKTPMLYDVSGCPAVSARVTNGANAPISRPDTMHTTMLLRETADRPAWRLA